MGNLKNSFLSYQFSSTDIFLLENSSSLGYPPCEAWKIDTTATNFWDAEL